MKLQLYAKGLVWSRGGGGGGREHLSFNWYLSNEKTAFVDKSRVEPTIFFIEKISFNFETFLWSFYGQSFIKTVRGPL